MNIPERVKPTLSQDDLDCLILGYAAAHGGITEVEAKHLIDWVERVRTDSAMIDIALKGYAGLSIGSDGHAVLTRFINPEERPMDEQGRPQLNEQGQIRSIRDKLTKPIFYKGYSPKR